MKKLILTLAVIASSSSAFASDPYEVERQKVKEAIANTEGTLESASTTIQSLCYKVDVPAKNQKKCAKAAKALVYNIFDLGKSHSRLSLMLEKLPEE